jgi:NAD(P)-dependent dehydrogenase (short-subunit alcohol dehydrogenase family)
MSGVQFLAAHGGVDDGLSRVDPAAVYPLRAALRFPVEEHFRCSLALALLRGLEGRPRDSPGWADAVAALGELMRQCHRGYTAIGLGSHATDEILAALAAVGPAGGVWGARISGGGNGGTVAVLCERAALPALEASPRGGRAVEVSSGTVKIAAPFHPGYGASKSGSHGLFRHVGAELALLHSNVSVTSCILGMIATPDVVRHEGLRSSAYGVPETARGIIEAAAARVKTAYVPLWIAPGSWLAFLSEHLEFMFMNNFCADRASGARVATRRGSAAMLNAPLPHPLADTQKIPEYVNTLARLRRN